MPDSSSTKVQLPIESAPAGQRLVIRAPLEGRLVAVAWVFVRADLSGGVADITLPGRPALRRLPVFPLDRRAPGSRFSADPRRVGSAAARNLVVRSKDGAGRWRTLAWLCLRTDGLGGLADLTVGGDAPTLLNLPITPLARRRTR